MGRAVSAVATRPRLGFLGLGWIGRSRLDALERAGAGEVAAIADPALPGALDSLDELLEHELDGVVIATPSALHAPQALAAIERGLAVFCQKPLARTAAETASVVEAARAADLLLGVDLSYRHVAAVRAAVDAVRAGSLGEVFAADLVFHNAYGPDKPWFYDPERSGGGCVIDLGLHLVDLALWAFGGEVVEVSARLRGEPVEEFAVAQLDLDSGAVVRLACSWNLSAGRDCVFEASFYGREGAALVRNVDGSFYDFRAELARGRARETLSEPPDDWGGRALVEWARRLGAGEGFDPASVELVRVAQAVDAIYGRSA
jgi:predicted dehydrogenase